MKGKKRILCCIVCLLLLLSITAQASEGGAAPKENGQSDVMAGVFVNYMKKLKFQILEEGSKNPISGASVEVYIPSLERYVLVGVTNEEGLLLLDVAHNTAQANVERRQLQSEEGEILLEGRLLYLNSNKISYQVYKYNWLPYPKQGSVDLGAVGIPQEVTEYLYQEEKTGGGGSHGGGGNGSTSFVKPSVPLTDGIDHETAPVLPKDGSMGIPKTGVEGTMQYWLFGLLFFSGAGLLLWDMQKKEGKEQEGER